MGIRKNLKRGFTLVELMIVVAIIGILAALAIYGVRRYVTNAKTAEARNSLGAIAKAAAMSYDREGMPGEVLSLTLTAGASNAFCGAADPVPGSMGSVQGQKYQSAPAEWDGSASDGWKCLMFTMEQPQYYQYTYNAPAARGDRTGSGDGFTAVAQGDLDGDGSYSTFILGGGLESDAEGIAMKVAPNVIETNPDE